MIKYITLQVDIKWCSTFNSVQVAFSHDKRERRHLGAFASRFHIVSSLTRIGMISSLNPFGFKLFNFWNYSNLV
ncbi:hypothetical protein SCA6_004037 [Theobroma cacao]